MPIASGPAPQSDPRTETPSPSAFGYDPEQAEYQEFLKKDKRALDVEEKSAAAQQKIGEEDIAERKKMRLGIEGAMADERAYGAKYPEQQKPPDPPNPEDYQKMSWQYLAAMVAVGAFAGKGIRNVSNAPLAAFGAAAKGWNEGNQQAYKNASAQWEQANRRVQEINRQQLEKYRAILENKRLTIDEMMQQYGMAAAENKDRIGYEAYKSGNFDKIAQHWAARMKTTQEFEARSQKMVDTLTQQNETAANNAEQIRGYLATPQGQQWFSRFSPAQQLQINGFVKTWAPETPGAAGATNLPPDLRGPQPLNMKPADMAARQFRLENYRAGKGEPTSEDWSRFYRQQHPARTAPAAALQEYIESYQTERGHPPSAEEITQFAQQFAAQTSAGRAVGTRLGNILVSAGEVEELAPQAIETSARVPRGKWVPLNKIAFNLRGQASDPAYTDFVAANRGLITAYGATMSRSGANTVSAQNHAEEAINLATSHEAYVQVVRRLQKEVDAVKRAPAHAMAALRQMGIQTEDAGTTQGPPAPAGGDDGFGQLRVH